MTGSGTLLDPYVIWDVNDLQNMSLDLAAYYELGQDIDASATIGWNAGAGFVPVGRGVTFLYPPPTADHSSGGAWLINPADGIMFDKILTNDGDATYIEATASPSWALFTVAPAIPAIVGSTIPYVVCFITRKKLGAGATSMQGYLRLGGFNYLIGAAQDSNNGMYSGSNFYAYTNPATGLAWTVAEVNSIEAFGVYVTNAGPNVRITQVYLRVRQDLNFKANVDGKGHSISSLFINRPTEDDIGLFGYTVGAVIQNINLVNVNMTGEMDVGALVGYANTNTRMVNCSSSGSITGAPDADSVGGLVGWNKNSAIENCHSRCSVTVHGGNPYDIGGLVGDHDGTSTMVDSDSTGDVDVSGGSIYDIGGLAGDQGALSVIRCHSTGNITIVATNDLSDCGGLVGDNIGIIEDSYATGNLTATINRNDGYDFGGLTGDNGGIGIIRRSFCTGKVTVTITAAGGGIGTDYIGGLTGDNSTQIENSYSQSDVEVDNPFVAGWNKNVGGFSGANSGAIDNCYSTGLLTVSAGYTLVGAFVGENTGTTTDCFWDIETSGWTTSAGGTGKTTAEMKNLATFLDAGWDIEARTIDKAGGYPYLAWQSVWYIFVAGVPAPISVITLPATEIR